MLPDSVNEHVVNTVEVEKSWIIKMTARRKCTCHPVNQVTKHIKMPQNQYTDKVDVSVAMQRQVSQIQPMHRKSRRRRTDK